MQGRPLDLSPDKVVCRKGKQVNQSAGLGKNGKYNKNKDDPGIAYYFHYSGCWVSGKIIRIRDKQKLKHVCMRLQFVSNLAQPGSIIKIHRFCSILPLGSHMAKIRAEGYEGDFQLMKAIKDMRSIAYLLNNIFMTGDCLFHKVPELNFVCLNV